MDLNDLAKVFANALATPWASTLAASVAALAGLALAFVTWRLARATVREGRSSRAHDREERRLERRLDRIQQASIHLRRSITRGEGLANLSLVISREVRVASPALLPPGFREPIDQALQAFADAAGDAAVWLRPLREALAAHGLSGALLDRLNEATKFADKWPINPEAARGYSAVATEVLDVLRRVLAEDIRST